VLLCPPGTNSSTLGTSFTTLGATTKVLRIVNRVVPRVQGWLKGDTGAPEGGGLIFGGSMGSSGTHAPSCCNCPLLNFEEGQSRLLGSNVCVPVISVGGTARLILAKFDCLSVFGHGGAGRGTNFCQLAGEGR